MAAYTTIDNPELYFQSKIWSGNNSGSGISITLDGDENMQPDLVWVKSRDATHAHVLYDSVRTSPAKYLLQPNTNVAERTAAIGSFDSDGVTFSDSDGFYNGSDTYVGWFWKESATAGFDIVTYTGNGSARTISHSLSAVPHWILQKERNEASNWKVYHHKNTSAPETDYLTFNTTAATDDYADYWNDTAPTSSVYSIGSAADINGSSDTYVTYLWSEKQGFSKFGKYIGNSSTNGPFVYLGFRPAFIIGKVVSDTNDWFMFDNKRNPSNPVDDSLYPNTAAVENTNHTIDFLSNGFKINDSDGTVNSDGNTYIYMAFAEAPFVNSNGVPCNAR